MLKKLEAKDFDKVFELMELSFPKDEYRTYEGQKALMNEELYQIYVIPDEEKDAIKALVTVWEYEKVAFVEHLAVNPAYRNGGLGSIILGEVIRELGKMICLEVELPETEMAARRIGFYKRNGFYLNEYPYIQPALAEGQEPVPLFVMPTERAGSEEEFMEIKELLYKEVYKVN